MTLLFITRSQNINENIYKTILQFNTLKLSLFLIVYQKFTYIDIHYGPENNCIPKAY